MKRLLILTVTAWSVAALSVFSGTTNSVPFSDDFEGYTNGTPLIDGTNGWYGSSAEIVVQTNVVRSGTNAAEIPIDCTLTNRCVDAVPTNIWLRMDARLVPYDGVNTPLVDTNTIAMFYVDSNGYFVVQNGTPTNWTTITNTVNGASVASVTETNWVHLHVYHNYTNKTYSLFMDYDLLKENIGFVNTNISTLGGFSLYNGGGSTTFLDNVSIIATNPADLSAQGTNWLPYLVISPTNLTRTILVGTNADSQAFEIWKTNGTLSMNYSNTVSSNWLAISPTNGTSAGEHKTISVIYYTTNLTPSTIPYTAVIQVNGTDATYGFNALNSPQYITVSVTVLAQPVLRVDPLGLTNEVSYGHSPTGQTVRVWNGSAPPRSSMSFGVTNNSPTWITVIPTNGACVDSTNTLSVAYTTDTLPAGAYTGYITVATATSSQTVRVSMRVNTTPALSVNVFGLTNLVIAGHDAISQSFTIRNASAEPRGTLRYNLSDNMTWVSLSTAEGTSTGEVDTIAVSYSTAGLSVGSYTGNITAAGFDNATGDAVDGAEIFVTMTVKGQAQLNTSVDGLTNSILENYAATNTFQVWNGSLTPRDQMAYVISEDLSWLSLTPTSGTVTDETNTISVVYDGGTMSTGTYSGTITLDAFDLLTGSRASGAPKTIPVELVITPRTPVNCELPEIRGIPYLGQTLHAWRGLWQNEHRLTFAYQWQMANDQYGNGLTAVTNEQGLVTGTNYVVGADARAKYLRVKVTAEDAVPWPVSTTKYSSFSAAKKIKAAVEDFNGDGKTDLWLFDPSSGAWRFAFSAVSEALIVFGGPGSTAQPGDYDGDGKVDPAIYEESTGLWSVMLSGSAYVTASTRFGGAGYSPVPRDYDGDGKTDPAVYAEATGDWMALISANGYLPASVNFGGSGYLPVPGDYDGDGKADPAIYEKATGIWTVMLSGSSYTRASLWFGGPDFTPALGDYDGDGKTDVAVYWVAGNHWWLRPSSTGVVREESFGTSNGVGIPAPGYYDHDAQCDPATIHMEGDFIVWSVLRSSEGYRAQSYQVGISRWRVSW